MQILGDTSCFTQRGSSEKAASQFGAMAHTAIMSISGNSAAKKRLNQFAGGSQMSVEELRLNKDILRKISKRKKEKAGLA